MKEHTFDTQDTALILKYIIFYLEHQLRIKELKQEESIENNLFKARGLNIARTKKIVNAFIKECKKTDDYKNDENLIVDIMSNDETVMDCIERIISFGKDN